MALRTPLSVTPHLYMGDSTGRPLDKGVVYFGEQDKDPEFYPINLFSDDALTKPLAQPVHTKGGYLYDKGDMVEPHAKELIYSVKVLDSYGRKVFYKGAMMRNSWNDDVIEQINAALVSTAEQSAQIATDVAKEIADKAVVSSGFVTIDSFELGATLTQRNQALRHTADGKLYRWAGDLPKVVPASSTPANSGGISANAWLEVSDVTLRQDIAAGDLVTDAVVKTTPVAAGAIVSDQAAKNKQFLDVSDFVDFNAVDHTTGLLNAVAAAKSQNKGLICRDTRTLKITDVVNMSGISRINFSGGISCRTETAQVVVGGFANSGTPPEIYFMDITNLDSVITKPAPANPLLVIKGMKGGCVTVGSCNYMQLYADATLVATSSNAYTRYYLKGVTRKFEITDSGVGKSWVTENFIYGGRIGELVIKGVSYVHNHNKFYNPTIEGSTFRLYFDRANQNAIYGVRAEQVANAVLEFTDRANYNKFVTSWSWTFDARGITASTFTIIDAGKANNVVNEAVYMYDLQHIVTADKHTVAIANDTDSASTCVAVNPDDGSLLSSGKARLTPGINGFITHSNRFSVLTDYVPVNSGDVIAFDVKCDSNGLRVVYWLYDENYKPITDTTDAIIQSSVSATSSIRYGHSTNVGGDIFSKHHAMIDNAQVKYVRIGVWSSGATFVNHIKIGILKKRGLSSTSSKVGVEQASQTLVMVGKPTMGYVPLNTLMYDTVAGAQRRVVFAHRTTLTTGISATDTTVAIDVATGVADGDIYGILLPSGKTSWGLVAGLTGSSFTITATGEDVSAGSMVVFNRWSEPPVVTPTP